MNTDIARVPIHCKMTLTIREAAEYSNIGINKIETLLKHGSRVEVLIEQGKVTIVEIKRKMRMKEA